jgi:hypothetical protein
MALFLGFTERKNFGRALFPVNPIGATSFNPLLLNIFPATAAFSLRLINWQYLGPCIRVRRSSDNAELDIGFTLLGTLDTASLLSFVGAGNGFVSRWYDQSGRSLDAFQGTAANQPRIVGSGVVDTAGGLPALLWTNGLGQRLINAGLSVSQPSTTFSVTRLSAATGINASIIYDSFNNVVNALYHTGTTESPNNILRANSATNVALNAGASTTNFQLITYLANSTSSVVRINGVQVVSVNAGTNGFSGLSIGHVRGNPNPVAAAYDFSGHISELIIYGSNETANFSSIESNIQTYYGI